MNEIKAIEKVDDQKCIFELNDEIVFDTALATMTSSNTEGLLSS